MKYLPNILSVLRILLCIPLLILAPFSLWFLILYTLAGITDMLDGPIARATNNCTEIGANLDGAADLFFAFVVLFRLIPVLNIIPVFLIWIAAIISIRAISVIVAYIRYKEMVFLHTYANKIAAFSLFTFPLLYMMIDINILLLILCLIVSAAFLEDLLINTTSRKLDRDIKGLFCRKTA